MTNTTKDIKITSIDENKGIVTFDDDSTLTMDKFNEDFTAFLQNRIAGETITYADMERFMVHRTSGKSLELLMKNKKKEGFLEGAGDRKLTTGQKIAIGSVVTIVMIAIVVFIILRGQGLIPV